MTCWISRSWRKSGKKMNIEQWKRGLIDLSAEKGGRQASSVRSSSRTPKYPAMSSRSSSSGSLNPFSQLLHVPRVRPNARRQPWKVHGFLSVPGIWHRIPLVSLAFCLVRSLLLCSSVFILSWNGYIHKKHKRIFLTRFMDRGEVSWQIRNSWRPSASTLMNPA